jgi:TatD DNase family protein
MNGTAPGLARLYDAHNHLQDERLQPFWDEIARGLDREPVAAMVVNGACQQDWPAVLALARNDSRVIPSFGYHPWYINARTAGWQEELARFLDTVPSGVGEIGLDKWVRGHDLAQQTEVFAWQMQLAAERNLPASIHCLQAWGTLLDLLRAGPRPQCGFVLHSFGGPREMIPELAALGAYFSLPGYFAHERKARQREAFLAVPPERMLIETDAPDQSLPPERVRYPLPGQPDGKPLNHPANLGAVYAFAAALLNEPIEALAARVEQNFLRVFGRLRRPSL